MKNLKKALGIIFTLAIVLTCVPTISAKAATKATKVTMYKGEEIQYYTTGISSITSIKSSNAKVVKASKDKDSKTRFNFRALKKGSATVTVKGKNYSGKVQTFTYKVTVYDTNFKVTLSKLSGGKVLVKIFNKTSQTFNSIRIAYAINNAQGETIKYEEDVRVAHVAAKKAAYYSVYVGSGNDDEISIKKSAAAVTGFQRELNYKYGNCSAKEATVTVKDETITNYDDGTPRSLEFKLKVANNTTGDITGNVYILYYDSNNKIIDIDTNYYYLNKKAVKTDSYTSGISLYSYPEFDHYEVVPCLYKYNYVSPYK